MRRLRIGLATLAILQALPGATQSAEPPDYRRMLLINSLVPGYAQHQLGQRREAWLYYPSLPLTVAGLAFTTLYLADLQDTGLERWVREDGRTYVLRSTGGEPGDPLLFAAGVSLSLYGTLLASYSSWAALRDVHDRASTGRRTGREGLGQLLVAPFRWRNLSHPSVFPVLPLIVLAGVAGKDLTPAREYFQRDSVSFLGFDMPPAAALALRLAGTMGLVAANATWEEIQYRGTLLEASGPTRSALSFGAAHLPNIFVPDAAIEDVALQSLFATLFGLHAARATVANGYNFEPMVALHFWNNVAAFMLDYILGPELASASIGLSVSY